MEGRGATGEEFGESVDSKPCNEFIVVPVGVVHWDKLGVL
jgi:hypothetical protein